MKFGLISHLIKMLLHLLTIAGKSAGLVVLLIAPIGFFINLSLLPKSRPIKVIVLIATNIVFALIIYIFKLYVSTFFAFIIYLILATSGRKRPNS